MPFFIRGKRSEGAGKRKKSIVKNRGKPKGGPPPSKKVKDDSSEDYSSDEEPFFTKPDEEEDDAHMSEEETAQEKKIRLAKEYLSELKKQKEQEVDDHSVDDHLVDVAIKRQLREDNLEAAGKLHRSIADTLIAEIPNEDIKILRCKQQKLPLTCIAVMPDKKYIYSASKEGSIVKWNFDGEKLGVIANSFKMKVPQKVGHNSHILSLAVSTDGKFLVSGDQKGIIHVWDGGTLEHLRTFKRHRKAVSGLCFRRGTHTLYSAAHDRLVMAWDLDEMVFTEDLGGHQDSITAIDSLYRESCITSGGRDEMVIVYSIVEEKQLRFTGQKSIDGVKLLNEKTFVTFGQSGSLDLWTTIKKKPHNCIPAAHGNDPTNEEPYWITAAATIINSDVVATGSSDGNIKLWKVDLRKRLLSPLFSIAVPGVINDLSFTPSGSHLIAAVAKEHKLGRWYKIDEAKNAVFVITLRTKS